MVLSPLSQNTAMEGDAVLERVVQLEALVTYSVLIEDYSPSERHLWQISEISHTF